MTSKDKAARRTRLLIKAGAALGLALGTPAAAQTADPAAQPDPVPPPTRSADPAAPDTLTAPSLRGASQPGSAAPGDIVVTGSRITSRDFSAPTPTQVIGAAEIAKNAEPNIFTTIAQLPS